MNEWRFFIVSRLYSLLGKCDNDENEKGNRSDN